MSQFMSHMGAFANANHSEIQSINRKLGAFQQSKEAEIDYQERQAAKPPMLRCIGHSEIKIRGVWHHNATQWLPNDPALHYAIGGEALANRVPRIRELLAGGAMASVPQLRVSPWGAGWVPTAPTALHGSQFPRAHSTVMLDTVAMGILFDWLDAMGEGGQRAPGYGETALGAILDACWGDEDAKAQDRIEDARCVFFFTE